MRARPQFHRRRLNAIRGQGHRGIDIQQRYPFPVDGDFDLLTFSLIHAK